MIYTVTFNPAIDYVVRTKEIRIGEVNRSDSEEIFFGGKGINVSIVLNELGVRSAALGFVAGFTGEAIEEGVKAMGIETDFVRSKKGNSRINIKIKSTAETEINCQGPDIDDEALGKLFDKLDRLSDGDTLILAGSVPRTLPPDIYERILQKLEGRRIRTVADATGELLMKVLRYRPFLIKPNDAELGELFGKRLKNTEEIIFYANKLREMGAENVLVSRAGEGAVLVDSEGRTHICTACKGQVRNSVGAGDSMVAGFIAGIEKGGFDYALKLGTAAGGATAFSDGLAKRELIEELMNQL